MTFGTKRTSLVLPALALLCAPPLPDMLLPGHRRVHHELVIDVPAGASVPVLVAFPTSGFDVARRFVPPEPFAFSSKYGTRLYVLAAGEALPRKVDAAWCGRHRSAAIPVTEVGSVPMGSPLARVRTKLRATASADGGLQLAVVASEQFDALDRPIDPGREAMWLLLPSGAGVLWLWWLSRRPSGGSR